MHRILPKTVAPLVAVTLVAVACGVGGSADPAAAPAPDAGIEVISIDADGDMAEAEAPEAASTMAADSTVSADLRQRCIDGIRILDRRWDEEGFEYPDEGPELSEEELEQTMAPAQPFEDGVAGPDERPALAAMGDFDPETMPIPQLDRFREACFEQGLVTEAELYGDEFEEGEFEAWCEELAEIPIEEVREFAAEEGADVVAEEFEACGLPNPLDG